MKRKKRVGEVVCRCSRYKFPHRLMGGDCKGGAFVERTWENGVWDTCRDCPHVEIDEYTQDRRCQVLDGREPAVTCPQLAEYIGFEEIKLYGVNRPPKTRSWLHRR